MENPTLVVLTDRNDLDDQLFGTFARCQRPAAPDAGAGRRPGATCASSCRSPPAAWSSRRSRSSSPKRRATDIPCSPTGATSSSSPTRPTAASTTSSTASPATCATRCRTPRSSASPARPIELTDTNTRAVFGDYISIYDIQRAVEDGATVPIYYESRLAKLELEGDGAAQARPRVRGGHRGRGGRAQGEAQEQVGAARSGGRHREAARS